MTNYISNPNIFLLDGQCLFGIDLLKQTNISIQKKSLLAPGVWCSALVSKIDVAELTVKVDCPNVQTGLCLVQQIHFIFPMEYSIVDISIMSKLFSAIAFLSVSLINYLKHYPMVYGCIYGRPQFWLISYYSNTMVSSAHSMLVALDFVRKWLPFALKQLKSLYTVRTNNNIWNSVL